MVELRNEFSFLKCGLEMQRGIWSYAKQVE